MLLVTTEIDLSAFFNVNLIIFTTIAFLFSVLIITLLVFGLRPITNRAKEAKGLAPEKINLVYLRLIIYILAEFIAFVSDIFLVIFGDNYTLPWATTIVFLSITFYKLVFVLFKDFKDLGFNAKGITDTLKTVTKVVKSKNLDPINEILDEQNTINKNNENSSKQSMNRRVKYKNKTLRSKLPMIFIFLLVPCFNLQTNSSITNFYTELPEKQIYTVYTEDFNSKLNSDTIIINNHGKIWAQFIFKNR